MIQCIIVFLLYGTTFLATGSDKCISPTPVALENVSVIQTEKIITSLHTALKEFKKYLENPDKKPVDRTRLIKNIKDHQCALLEQIKKFNTKEISTYGQYYQKMLPNLTIKGDENKKFEQWIQKINGEIIEQFKNQRKSIILDHIKYLTLDEALNELNSYIESLKSQTPLVDDKTRDALITQINKKSLSLLDKIKTLSLYEAIRKYKEMLYNNAYTYLTNYSLIVNLLLLKIRNESNDLIEKIKQMDAAQAMVYYERHTNRINNILSSQDLITNSVFKDVNKNINEAFNSRLRSQEAMIIKKINDLTLTDAIIKLDRYINRIKEKTFHRNDAIQRAFISHISKKISEEIKKNLYNPIFEKNTLPQRRELIKNMFFKIVADNTGNLAVPPNISDALIQEITQQIDGLPAPILESTQRGH